MEGIPSISLHQAVELNDRDVINDWLHVPERDEYLNSYNCGLTPLHYAAMFKHVEALKQLLDAGADPNIKSSDKKEYTALHFLAISKTAVEETDAGTLADQPPADSAAITCLLQKADIKLCDSEGCTALHLACRAGNLEFLTTIVPQFESLFKALELKNSNEKTPLHEACWNGHLDVVKELTKSDKLNEEELLKLFSEGDVNKKTPLHFACQKGHTEIAKYMIQKLCNDRNSQLMLLKQKDSGENMPFHLACENGSSKLIEYLMTEHQCFVEDPNEGGLTPLHIIVQHGHMEVAKKVIFDDAFEVNLNIMDSSNCTPLHYAAKYNRPAMVIYLQNKNANILAIDEDSYTPLRLAAFKGSVKAFKTLLRKASIDEYDSYHRTVAHIAAEEGHTDILECVLLDPNGETLANSEDIKSNKPLHLAARRGNTECVKLLLKDVRVNDVKNHRNKTPMHYAASEGHVEVMKILIKNQSSCVRVKDNTDNTPLHYAAANGHLEATKLLLDYKVNGELKNNNGRTPMHEAAYNGHAHIVQFLIKSKVAPKPQKKERDSPLSLAAQEGHLEVVNILLENDAELRGPDGCLGPLDLAIENNYENIAMAIVKSKGERWKDALRNISTSHGKTTTPLRRLIERMPRVAKEVYDRCYDEMEIKNDLKVTFDYEFLEDMIDKPVPFKRKSRKIDDSSKPQTFQWHPEFSRELHPLSIMVKHHRIELLKHPLVSSLMNLRWTFYGLTIYLFNFLVYSIFLTFLTSFAIVSPNPQSITCQAVSSGIFGQKNNETIMYIRSANECELVPMDTNDSIMENLQTGSQICSSIADKKFCNITDEECGICDKTIFRRGFLIIAAAIVVAFAGIRLLLEILQFVSFRLHYIKDWQNYLELPLFWCSVIFSSVFINSCLCPTYWQWQIGCIAVFLAWIDFILFFAKLPIIGIYVLMLINISKTFGKLLVLAILLLIAFGLAFYMAFDDFSPGFARSPFATFGRSLLKTMAMTTGEIEHDSIFRQFPGGIDDDQNTLEVPFFQVSVLLWIIFIILMPILFSNLLIGLAVDDIQGIQTAAELERMKLQIEFTLSVEQFLSVFHLRRNFSKKDTEFIIYEKRNPFQFLMTIFGSTSDCFNSHEDFKRSLRPSMKPIEQIQSSTESVLGAIKQMRQTIQEVKEIKSTLKEMINDMKQRKEMEKEVMKEMKSEMEEEGVSYSLRFKFATDTQKQS